VRNEGYAIMRAVPATGRSLQNLSEVLAASTTETVLVAADSPVTGRNLRALDLRRQTGATVIAVVRRGEPFTNPGAEFTLEASDVLVLFGSHQALALAQRAIQPAAARQG